MGRFFNKIWLFWTIFQRFITIGGIIGFNFTTYLMNIASLTYI